MSTVKRFIESLKPERFVPSGSIFPRLDPSAIANDLRILEQARERGKQELPPSDFDSPTDLDSLDPVESEIIAEIGRVRLMGINSYEEHMETYARRLGEAANSKAELTTVAARAVTDYETSVAVHRDALSNARLRVIERFSERKFFIMDNQLRRTAYDQKSFLFFLSLVLLLIVIESAINGYFFAANNALGLLGGGTVAFVISMVNVGFSLVASFFCRNISHIRAWRKLMGFAVLLIYIPFITLFNLAVVHFRDATIMHSWELAVTKALDTLFQDPFALDSFESWLLLFLSILVCMLSFWKGYAQHDPYPDYSRVHHRWEEARDDYAACVEEARIELEALRNEAISDLEDARRMLSSNIREASDIIYARSGLSGHLERFLEQTELLTNHLIMVYREANQAARTTASPSHFKRSYSFRKVSISPPHCEVQHNSASSEINEINSIVDQTIDQIFQRYSEAVHRFESIEDLERKANECPVFA